MLFALLALPVMLFIFGSVENFAGAGCRSANLLFTRSSSLLNSVKFICGGIHDDVDHWLGQSEREVVHVLARQQAPFVVHVHGAQAHT